jgi:hypothetical protein
VEDEFEQCLNKDTCGPWKHRNLQRGEELHAIPMNAPAPTASRHTEEYEVEAVVGKRTTKGIVRILSPLF